jgi:hypothetical protein
MYAKEATMFRLSDDWAMLHFVVPSNRRRRKQGEEITSKERMRVAREHGWLLLYIP